MSIWGSLLGGVIGFSFGGPFGALLGSFLGGKISRLSSSKKISGQQNAQEVFALSLIILSAKLSKADGHVSKEELIAVKEKLQIPDSEIDQVAQIFNKAKDESTGYEPYAKQIAEIFKGNINVLEEVINILFYIAEADGHVSSDEEDMIANIAYIFGLSQKQYQSIKESRKSSDKLNPYIVLESQPTDNLQIIRKKYIKLSKEHHPDLLMSKGVPVEVINESKNKMRAINAAWDQVQKLKSN
jgi:DnaJ like chaperone protein